MPALGDTALAATRSLVTEVHSSVPRSDVAPVLLCLVSHWRKNRADKSVTEFLHKRVSSKEFPFFPSLTQEQRKQERTAPLKSVSLCWAVSLQEPPWSQPHCSCLTSCAPPIGMPVGKKNKDLYIRNSDLICRWRLTVCDSFWCFMLPWNAKLQEEKCNSLGYQLSWH